jgi:hypothetical protein
MRTDASASIEGSPDLSFFIMPDDHARVLWLCFGEKKYRTEVIETSEKKHIRAIPELGMTSFLPFQYLI